MSQLLEEGKHKQEVVDGALALQISWPLSETLGKLLGVALESKHPLIHPIYLSNDIYPEQASVAANSRDDVCIQPANGSAALM